MTPKKAVEDGGILGPASYIADFIEFLTSDFLLAKPWPLQILGE